MSLFGVILIHFRTRIPPNTNTFYTISKCEQSDMKYSDENLGYFIPLQQNLSKIWNIQIQNRYCFIPIEQNLKSFQTWLTREEYQQNQIRKLAFHWKLRIKIKNSIKIFKEGFTWQCIVSYFCGILGYNTKLDFFWQNEFRPCVHRNIKFLFPFLKPVFRWAL